MQVEFLYSEVSITTNKYVTKSISSDKLHVFLLSIKMCHTTMEMILCIIIYVASIIVKFPAPFLPS